MNPKNNNLMIYVLQTTNKCIFKSLNMYYSRYLQPQNDVDVENDTYLENV